MFVVSSSFSVSDSSTIRKFSKREAVDGQPRRQQCCKSQPQQDRIENPGKPSNLANLKDLHSKVNNLHV